MSSWWGVCGTMTMTTMTILGTARGFAPLYFPSPVPIIASSSSSYGWSFATTCKTTIRPFLYQRRQQEWARRASALSTTVEIWDDVWTPVQCQQLHQQAVEHNARIQDDSLVFVYTPGMTIPQKDDDRDDNNHPDTSSAYSSLSPLEFAIASILDQLRMQHNDDEPLSSAEHDIVVVEYWCRQDYLDLQVHSDIDEECFQQTVSTSSTKNKMSHREDKNNNHQTTRSDVDPSSMTSNLRYPQFGHVLYLLAAEDLAAVGPTCIFPTKLGGWDTMMSPTHSREESDGRRLVHDETVLSLGVDRDDPKEAEELTRTTAAGVSTLTSSEGRKGVPMIMVPFVPGRLVRFQGSAMHGVPKPLHKWFLSKDEQEELEWRDEEEEEEDDDFDKISHDPSRRNLRSVILFNLWNQTGPMGVPTRAREGERVETMPEIPEGIVLSERDDDADTRPPEYDIDPDPHDLAFNVSAEIQDQTVCWDQSMVNSTARERNPFHTPCRSVSDWTKAPWIEPLDNPFVTSSSSNSQEMTDSHRSTGTRWTIPLMGTKRRRLHSKKFVVLDSQPPNNRKTNDCDNPETQEGGDEIWTRTAPLCLWLEEQQT